MEEGWRWTGLRSLASAMRGNEDWGVYWVVKQFIKSGSRKARAPTVCTAGTPAVATHSTSCMQRILLRH